MLIAKLNFVRDLYQVLIRISDIHWHNRARCLCFFYWPTFYRDFVQLDSFDPILDRGISYET